MQRSDLEFLTSSQGERLLTELAHADLSKANRLSLVSQLRQTYNMEEVSAALTQADLREKAVTKFGASAQQMFFTDDALQQASDPLVRAYRAARFGSGQMLDLCCSIGVDSIAFAEHAEHVHGIELSLLRAAIARHNAQVCGMDNVTVQVDDVTTYASDHHYAGIFFDPARRDDQGRRIYDVRRYIPPLHTLDRYDAPLKLAKVAPGVDLDHVDADAVQFISVEGDLKEAILVYGVPSSAAPEAVYLSNGAQALTWKRERPPEMPPITTPKGWFIEPDAALIRAGLVQDVANAYNAAMLDDTIAYLTADALPESPWVRGWQVLDWMPFNLKKLKKALQAQNVGTITVKKRGSPVTPEELTRKLKLKGDEARTLVLTRQAGAPIVIICAEYTA